MSNIMSEQKDAQIIISDEKDTSDDDENDHEMNFKLITDRCHNAKKMLKTCAEVGLPVDYVSSKTGETLLFCSETEIDVKVFLAAGVPRDAQDINGNTLLHVSRDQGINHALLQSGADPHGIRNKFGETPYQANLFIRNQLHNGEVLALMNRQVQLLEILVEKLDISPPGPRR